MMIGRMISQLASLLDHHGTMAVDVLASSEDDVGIGNLLTDEVARQIHGWLSLQ